MVESTKEASVEELTPSSSSTILEIIKKKELNELTEDELIKALLVTAQNNLTQNQRISELERRLEDVESKLESIEVSDS